MHRNQAQVQTLPRAANFNLSRWFAAVALLSISALALAFSVLLTWFLSSRMLAREGELTNEFVRSLLVVETPLQAYIAEPSPALAERMAASFEHIREMPDILRANIYDPAHSVIWSSERALIGRRFDRNHELERALAGEVVVKREDHPHGQLSKPEHQALTSGRRMFVEIYVPVPDPSHRKVIGVIEFYKQPQALEAALAELRAYIAVGAGAGSLLLFGALFGLVRRADQTIRTQQRQLIDQSTLAALGQMSGAVAHGIRNPLAAIRSSAEVIPGADTARANEAANDIIAQSDRLEAWVRELLSYTQPLNQAASPVPLPSLLERCLKDFAHDFDLHRIEVSCELQPGLPPVYGDVMLLTQVLRSLFSNAMEAMHQGGRLHVRVGRGEAVDGVTLEVRDTGPGMDARLLARVGQPFYTTKPRGLGVGLALARRIVEGSGGRLDIDSAPGRGTSVRVRLQTAG